MPFSNAAAVMPVRHTGPRPLVSPPPALLKKSLQKCLEDRDEVHVNQQVRGLQRYWCRKGHSNLPTTAYKATHLDRRRYDGRDAIGTIDSVKFLVEALRLGGSNR
jgi:hypothetical protein